MEMKINFKLKWNPNKKPYTKALKKITSVTTILNLIITLKILRKTINKIRLIKIILNATFK